MHDCKISWTCVTLCQMNNEATIGDVREAVNTLSTHVDGQFRRVDEQLREIKGDITQLKGDVTQMKATMVTKDYLDDKLADLRGDLVVLMRKPSSRSSASALRADRRALKILVAPRLR